MATSSKLPPSRLDDEARKVWNDVYPELEAAGQLVSTDYALLESYCMVVSAIRNLTKGGMPKPTIVHARRGTHNTNPDFKALESLYKQQREFSAALGIGVTSRKRIGKMEGKKGSKALLDFATSSSKN